MKLGNGIVLYGTYEDHLGDILLFDKQQQQQAAGPGADGEPAPQVANAEAVGNGGSQQRGPQPCTVRLRGQTDKVLTFSRPSEAAK